MTIGERIKETRKVKGLKQKELGEKLGVSYVVISQYERGERNPKVETLRKIADALEVSINDLLGTEDGDKGAILKAYASESTYKELQELSKMLNISIPMLILKSIGQAMEVLRAKSNGEEPRIVIKELQDYLDNKKKENDLDAEEDEH